MKKYKFYYLKDIRSGLPFYIGLTTRDLKLRLREHIAKAKWSAKPEVKNRKGEKAQYGRMVQIGWHNLDIVLLIEQEFETRKKAMKYETSLIADCIASGHNLVNQIQRKVVTQAVPRPKTKSTYNRYSRYRQPERWYPHYEYKAIEVKPTETTAQIKKRMNKKNAEKIIERFTRQG